MSLTEATARYWTEFGRHHKNADDMNRDLARLCLLIGPRKALADITDNDVADAVSRRRGDGVTNATVNRSIIEPLRQVIRKAVKSWKVPVPLEPDWSAHRLKEPKERVRELTDAEEAAIESCLREDYRPIWRFSLVTGFRMMESVTLTWAQIDWSRETISVVGKGDVSATLPLDSDALAILSLLRGHHPDRVFTYVVQRSRDDRFKDERLPITQSGLKTAWRRARAKAVEIQPSLKTFRWHDNRHTAASRILRETGNLKIVSKILRHSDVSTTSKYSHVQMDDIRAAMEAVAKSRKKLQKTLKVRTKND